MFYTIFMYLITERLCLLMGESSKISVKLPLNVSVPKDILKKASEIISKARKSVNKFRAGNSLNISSKNAAEVYKEDVESNFEIIISSPSLKPKRLLEIVGNFESIDTSKNIFAKLYRTMSEVKSSGFVASKQRITNFLEHLPNKDNLGKTEKKLEYTSKEKKAAEEYYKNLKKSFDSFKKYSEEKNKDKKIIVKNHYDENKSKALYDSVGGLCEKLSLFGSYFEKSKNSGKLAEYATEANNYLIKYMGHEPPELNLDNFNKYLKDEKFLPFEENNITYESIINFNIESSKKEYEELYNRLHEIKLFIKGDKKSKDTAKVRGKRDLIGAGAVESLKQAKDLKNTFKNLQRETEELIGMCSKKPSLQRKLQKLYDKFVTDSFKAETFDLFENYYNTVYELKYGNAVKSDSDSFITYTEAIYVTIKDTTESLDGYRKKIMKFIGDTVEAKKMKNVYDSLCSDNGLKGGSSRATVETINNKINDLNTKKDNVKSLIEESGNLKEKEEKIKKLNKFSIDLGSRVTSFKKDYEKFHKEYMKLKEANSTLGKAKAMIAATALLIIVLTKGTKISCNGVDVPIPALFPSPH